MDYGLFENYVSVSEFSQGKANKIFNEVYTENKEFVVMKNNKPTAVVMSIAEYDMLSKRIETLEHLVETMSKDSNQCVIGIAEGMFRCPENLDTL